MSTFRFRTLALVAATGLIPLAAGCAVNADDGATSSDEALNPATGSGAGVAAGAAAGDKSIAGTTTDTAGLAAGGIGAPVGPLSPEPLAAPTVTTTGSGAGWSNVTISGQAIDGASGTLKPVSGTYTIVHGREALASAGLSTTAQTAIKSALSPTRAADDEEVIIIPAEAMRVSLDNDKAPAGTMKTMGLCSSDSRQTFEKDYTFEKTFSTTKGSEPGNFTGSATLGAYIWARAFATIDYTAVRHWYLGCAAVPVIHSVGVRAAGTVKGMAKVDATFQKKWSWSTTIAQPEIGTVTLPIVPIPITFSVPIRVGIDADAHAELHSDGVYSLAAGFDYKCTSSGCTPNSAPIAAGHYTANSPASGSVSAMVKVTPWAETGIHAKVLWDSVAYAEAVVRVGTPTDLFGYAGNTCGDANGDGTNEFVTGASIDANVALDVRAKAGFVTNNYGPWTWNVYNDHIGFWKVYDGGLFEPMLHPSTAKFTRFSSAASVVGGMRPCWPYADKMNYQMAWGDGLTSAVNQAALTQFTQSHSYASPGSHTVSVQALTDAKGRALNTSASTTVSTSGFGTVGPIDGTLLSQ